MLEEMTISYQSTAITNTKSDPPAAPISLTEKYFVDKEISWLYFNERVLQETRDHSVPIIERIRLLGIVSNNLDEFFRVRVSDVRRRMLLEDADNVKQSTAAKLLRKLQRQIVKLQKDYNQIYRDLFAELKKNHIYFLVEEDLSDAQRRYLRSYFRESVLPILAPIMLDEDSQLPTLSEQSIYLALKFDYRNKDARNKPYAVLEVPTDRLSRFIQIPSQRSKRIKRLIMLDDVLRIGIDEIFTGLIDFQSISAYTVKLTRDAELTIGDGITQSFLDKISFSLKGRHAAQPTRLMYERGMPKSMVEFFVRQLNLSEYDSVIQGEKYHNFKDFMGFPNLGPAYLENKPLATIPCSAIDAETTTFDAVKKADVFLHYPYQSFSYFTNFLREAAIDSRVTEIRISIYRVASESRVMNSLINAAQNGKAVHVIVELQARFDEKANIQWAQRLTEAGVKVSFGIQGLKFHSKICLIKRIEDGVEASYAVIGTGNFHEKTARVYTDFAVFTANAEITSEVEKVFEFSENSYRRYDFDHLLVSPINFREQLRSKIDREMNNARAGKQAWIFIKVNNLSDAELIEKLYEASRVGVKVKIIARSICSLVPQVTGVSDNIQVTSIVGRFLEHSRVYIFANDDEPSVYISSADMMSRNIDHRVEVSLPVYDKTIKRRIIDILRLQSNDNCRARIIDQDHSNRYVARGNRRKVDSQIAIHEYLVAAESGRSQQAIKALLGQRQTSLI